MLTYLLYPAVAVVAAVLGALAWQIFVAGPEVHAADTARAELAAKLLNAQEQKREDDAEYNRLHDESTEAIAEWKAALEAAQAEAETWKTAYTEGLIGRPRALAPVAAEVVMAPETVGDDELDAWHEIAARVPVSEYHSGFTGSWPKEIFQAATEAAAVAS